MPNYRLPRTLKYTDSGRGHTIGCEAHQTLNLGRLHAKRKARIEIQREANKVDVNANWTLSEKLAKTYYKVGTRVSVRDFKMAQAARERAAQRRGQ